MIHVKFKKRLRIVANKGYEVLTITDISETTDPYFKLNKNFTNSPEDVKEVADAIRAYIKDEYNNNKDGNCNEMFFLDVALGRMWR